ncbi:CRISPR-associated endonuclease Cas2 [Halocalculus aciditolerans]|uniref:CRISPR-associated endoribonuclease Cas2 n=1 Tax=Halocalculus aciditolerans TaxID=1383812 RepID=A0A830FBB8_9EURY|nr:CRISPR-associated endonuclease Cas2 [Halocalculus aciditolerans]GGL58133.1 CRISPR-associated endoribonuclease Cas2 [Halocalculus aciditolerans]
MPYIIAVYDVDADRTHLFLKLFRRYLTHIQNSVLEGFITDGRLQRLRGEIEALLEPHESVLIYEVSSEDYVDRTVFGTDPKADDTFL